MRVSLPSLKKNGMSNPIYKNKKTPMNKVETTSRILYLRNIFIFFIEFRIEGIVIKIAITHTIFINGLFKYEKLWERNINKKNALRAQKKPNNIKGYESLLIYILSIWMIEQIIIPIAGNNDL